MNTSPRIVLLVACAAAFAGEGMNALGENPLVPVPERAKVFLDPAEMLLRSAPANALQRLRDPATATEAAVEVNRYLGQYATNKSIVLHAKVEAAESRPDVRNAFRIRAASTPLVWYGGTMTRLSWLYFQEADAPAANAVKEGAEITVTGWVRKCEVVTLDEGPRLNFDIQYTRILEVSNPLPKKEITAHSFTPAGIAGTWIWDSEEKIYPGTIDFKADGTGSQGARNNLTWKETGEREITIAHAARGTAVIRFDPASATFDGTDYYGKPVTGRRFRQGSQHSHW